MDESDNKKRRNLMITSSAVVATLFLRLKIPSAAVGILSIRPDLAVELWRIWALVLALLFYQVWRFLTDPTAKLAWDNTAEFFTRRFSEYAPDSLRTAIHATVLGRRKFGYHIELMSELPEPRRLDTKRSVVGIRIQDSSGAILPWTVWTTRTGECQASYELHEADGRRSWSSFISAKYALPIWQPILWYLRAAYKTLWRSPDCQDLLVPVLLAALAAGGSGTRLIHSLAA